jgi:hypothetical protein
LREKAVTELKRKKFKKGIDRVLCLDYRVGKDSRDESTNEAKNQSNHKDKSYFEFIQNLDE